MLERKMQMFRLHPTVEKNMGKSNKASAFSRINITNERTEPISSIDVARRFLELQQLRRRVRIAECGRMAMSSDVSAAPQSKLSG
jgi:hypothetical protein